MERNIMITANAAKGNQFELSELLQGIKSWASAPVRLLARYYSSVLEKEVSTRQTWHLIEVQAAFFAGIFPADISIALRLLAAVWFVSSLVRCRKALNLK